MPQHELGKLYPIKSDAAWEAYPDDIYCTSDSPIKQHPKNGRTRSPRFFVFLGPDPDRPGNIFAMPVTNTLTDIQVPPDQRASGFVRNTELWSFPETVFSDYEPPHNCPLPYEYSSLTTEQVNNLQVAANNIKSALKPIGPFTGRLSSTPGA